MKAIVFDERLRFMDAPKPKAKAGEALIRVRMAGMCNTDIEITKGYMGFKGILGHEFVGEVVECADEDWLGKRVVGEINIGCGKCPACVQGMDRHCPDRSVLGIKKKHGAFAEYITLPLKNLMVVPDSIYNQEAVFIEPLAAACEILDQVHIGPSHHVAIVGDGKLGQLIARVLRLTGCRIRLFGKTREKLKHLKDLGIESAVSNTGLDEKFNVVVEASGDPSGFDLALNLIKPRGTLVLKSTTHKQNRSNIASLVIDEITLIGSRCGRFEPAMKLIDSGLVDVKPLISEVFLFHRGTIAFRAAQRPEVLKVLLDMR